MLTASVKSVFFALLTQGVKTSKYPKWACAAKMGLSLIYFMFLILDSTSFRKRTSFSQLFQYQPHTYIKTWCQIWTNRINRWRKAEMISIKISKNPEHYRPVTSVSYSWLNGNHLYGRRRRWISRSRSELFAISGNHRSPTCLTTFLNPWLKN